MIITEQDVGKAVILTDGGIGIIRSFYDKVKDKAYISNIFNENHLHCDEFGFSHDKINGETKVVEGFVGIDQSEKIQKLEQTIESLKEEVERMRIISELGREYKL